MYQKTTSHQAIQIDFLLLVRNPGLTVSALALVTLLLKKTQVANFSDGL